MSCYVKCVFARYLGDVKLKHSRMMTLALKLCKASSGEENLQHVHGPVIMHDSVIVFLI